VPASSRWNRETARAGQWCEPFRPRSVRNPGGEGWRVRHKLAANDLAFVQLASIRLRLRVDESTP